MPKAKQSLSELLYEVKRIEEHREVLTEKKIKAMYQSLMKDLRGFLAESFEMYADADGRLFLSYLDAQNKRAKFLEEIAQNVNGISPKLKGEMLSLVEETYAESYKGMEKAIKEAEKSGKLAVAAQELSVQPDVLKEAVNNNISKLTLPNVMEKHRAEIVYQIQQALNVGLMNGDRYEQMAKRISERVNVSYSKAMNIARTESHRNTESGFMDCAERIQKGIDGSDYIYAATWRTMKDERVRPQQRKRGKGGKWKTTLSRNGANHMKMEGVTVKVGDFFNLGGGVKTKAPSQSGVAAQDCNCRCYLEYNLMTLKEFEKATGKPAYTSSIHGTTRERMNENGVADLELQRTTDAKAFDKAIREKKKEGGAAACVDTHPIEELSDFKLFLSENKMAGVAVKPDGDITAVFKRADYKVKGGVNDLIITARENGGEKMDCYGSFLVNSYEKCGYKPVARIPFNADYVDDAYLLATKPDVYIMMKNTDDLETVIMKNAKKLYKTSTQEMLDNLPTFTDYDAGLKYRNTLLAKQKKGILLDAPEKHYTLSVTKEPAITETLQKAVSKTNGKLSGLDFRLKTESSYKRKVEKEVIDVQKKATKEGIKVAVTKEDVTENMRDVVRYTCLSEKGDLVKDYNKIMGTLENDGYKVVRVKNTFKPDAPYKGINTIVQDPDGYNFELQFHTPQSFELKNGILHELYEKERLVTTPQAEKVILQKRMKEISDSIVFPDNVDKIKAFNDLPDLLEKLAKKTK